LRLGDSLLRDLDDEDRWLTLEEFGIEDHKPTDSFGSGRRLISYFAPLTTKTFYSSPATSG